MTAPVRFKTYRPRERRIDWFNVAAWIFALPGAAVAFWLAVFWLAGVWG